MRIRIIERDFTAPTNGDLTSCQLPVASTLSFSVIICLPTLEFSDHVHNYFLPVVSTRWRNFAVSGIGKHDAPSYGEGGMALSIRCRRTSGTLVDAAFGSSFT
jgi:hypothetical protein